MLKAQAVVLIGVLLVFGGCDKVKEASQKVAKVAKADPKVLKVKGLWLGMNIDEVPAILKKQLPKWSVSGVKDLSKGYYYIPGLISGLIEPGSRFIVEVGGEIEMGAHVVADKDKKVSGFMFGYAVDDLFNSADMDAKSFAQKFVSSYNIPKMKPSSDMQSWEYTSPDGFKVSINTKFKFLTIAKVASERERQFN